MANITKKDVFERIRGNAPKAYGLEVEALLTHCKHAKLEQTKKNMALAILADKGSKYPKLFEALDAVDEPLAVLNAQIGKLSSRMRSVKSALIKAQPLELFPVFEVITVNVGTSTKRVVVFAHEAMKVPAQREEIARRYQHMEKNGKAGIVLVKKFVMLTTGHQFNPPKLP